MSGSSRGKYSSWLVRGPIFDAMTPAIIPIKMKQKTNKYLQEKTVSLNDVLKNLVMHVICFIFSSSSSSVYKFSLLIPRLSSLEDEFRPQLAIIFEKHLL